jgi:hypothetical protein
MRAWALGLFVMALGAACNAQTEVSGLSTCDPLAAETPDITLASIIGAGQGADGTVYVVDKAATEMRAFVSQDSELYRQRVSGSGEAHDNGSLFTVSLNELDPPLTIQVTTDADGTTLMGVVTGPLDTKTFVIGDQGEELTPLTAKDARALPIHNYPSEILVEYSAALDDGRLLVVLRPRDFSDYLEFRVFFGPPDHLDERQVTSVIRRRDGGSTDLDFEVDGKPAHAAFPVESTADGFVPGPPSLSIDDQDIALSLSAPATSPAGAAYYCTN